MEGFQREYKFLPSNSESGDWEVYNTETGETLETLRGYETRGAAADAVYDKYVTDQGIPFNLRPVDPETPEKPLTQREKLATNIKAQGPAPKTYYKWDIDNPKTGETNTDYMTRERVFQTTRKAEKDNPKDGKYTNTIVGKGSVQVNSSEELRDIDEMSFDFRAAGSSEVIEHKRFNRATDSINGYTSPVVVAIERANELSEELGKPVVAYEVPTKNDQSSEPGDNLPHTWEFYYAPTGRVLDTVTDISASQARAVLGNTIRRYDDLDSNQIRMRTVPTDTSRERYNDRRELNPVIDQPPAGFQTQRPATGDYYEVRGGNDRVYGYITGDSGRSNNGNDVARDSKRYVNELTGTDGAYIQYRAGDPVQAQASNGVPMWQIYQRDNGHVVHEFADHDQTSAWATGQTWLRSIGAEPSSFNEFSVRPKMES
jgi:hypothetical protein